MASSSRLQREKLRLAAAKRGGCEPKRSLAMRRWMGCWFLFDGYDWWFQNGSVNSVYKFLAVLMVVIWDDGDLSMVLKKCWNYYRSGMVHILNGMVTMVQQKCKDRPSKTDMIRKRSLILSMELWASKFDLFWATQLVPNGGTQLGFGLSLSCSPWKNLWNMKCSSDAEFLCWEHVETYL